MAITDWIDKLARVWEVSDGKGGTVYSYRLYEKNEFPAAIVDFPSAVSYVTEAIIEYSAGGPCIDFYRGVTEFHLVPGAEKSNIPYVLEFFARIRDAAARNIQLSSTVARFTLRSEAASIQGPVVLQYGAEEPHLGLIVFWEVKENVSGDFAVQA